MSETDLLVGNHDDSGTIPVKPLWWHRLWPPSKWSRVAVTAVFVGFLALIILAATLFSWGGWRTKNVKSVEHSSIIVKSEFIRAMKSLDDKIQGKVVWPEDAVAFEQSAKVWNLITLEQPPALVVEVASESDVQIAVPFLHAIFQNFSVPFRIRSGGHSYAGWSTIPQGIILSLSQLNDLHFELNENEHDDDDDGSLPTATVTLGPAVRVRDILNNILKPYEYSSVIGFCPDVGEGGYTLGGGQGMLTRGYGLGLDNLVSARVVLADGRGVTASATEHPDLFWAIRGAGQNNFGVVTQMTSTYYPVKDEFLMGVGVIPLDQAPAFLAHLGNLNAPRQSAAVFIRDFGAALIDVQGAEKPVSVAFWWNGEDLTEGREFWNATLNNLLPSSVASAFKVSSTSWYNLSFSISGHEGLRISVYNGFLYPAQNTPETWDFILNHLWSTCDQTPYANVYMELWGGDSAFNDVPANATAFYWRDAIYSIRLDLLMPQYLGLQEFERLRQYFDEQWAVVEPYLTGTYTNYAQASLQHPAERTYGANLPRLQAIKQKYDPDNAFFHPHGIPLPLNQN